MTLLLTILIISILLLFFFRKLFRSENAMLKKAILNHNQLVCALVQKESVYKKTIFSEDELQKIVSMTEADWNEWECQISRMYKYYSANNYLVTDFLNEYFPGLFTRVLFKRLTAKGSKIDKKEAAIRSLSFEEIQILSSISEEDWSKRNERNSMISRIISDNPDGIKTYKEIHKITYQLSKSVLLQNYRTIEHLQFLFLQAQNLIDWEKKQKEFSSQYRNHIREWYPNVGYYTYKIPYKRTKKDGSRELSSYVIWQSFTASFSQYYLDEQPERYRIKYNRLSEFKQCTRYYYNHIYDSIFNIIQKIEAIYKTKPLVVFVDNTTYEWPSESYNYHYSYLQTVLNENEYEYTNMATLCNMKKDCGYRCVMLIDFITTNDDLLTNCNLVLDYFKDQPPVIGYHSILKEFSDKEILDIIEQKNKEENDDRNNIEYIKSLFLQVNKNDYFVYFAIINVLIGQASQSDEIKKAWLSNPDTVYVDGDCKNGTISFTYSIDGEANKTFTMEGNEDSIDDVSKFSYMFFKKVGLWEQFKQNGLSAINKMNTLGVLAYQ